MSTAYNLLGYNRNHQKGVSIVETILVIFIAGILVLLLANLPNAIGLITKSKNISLAREIAVKQIEDKRTTSFTNLINNTSNISDSRISLLPNGSGTIIIEDCSLQVCTNGEEVKLVTVTVNWKENNKDQSVSLKTMIGQGGINQ